ncbi:TRAPP trafficking subunit Trs65-domain-containing protein [Amylostereum chailletii]|nr:TRAPP trafficking subunit Trs65-domain-containing protein [Amylostereum chailletii]
MPSLEDVVSTATLDIAVPDTSLGFIDDEADKAEWLKSLKSNSVERKLAFFDEYLEFLLVLRLDHPYDDLPPDPARPPLKILSFLTHTQISYDAAYISSYSMAPAPAVRVDTPPRPSSLKPRGRVPPNIVPPPTPNPTPSAAEHDRRYVKAEGTPLASGVWGETDPVDKVEKDKKVRDAFALLWDSDASVWVALFRMSVNVAFLRIPYRDPLLCLTAYITLREKPVPMTPAREPLAALLAEAGGLPTSPTTSKRKEDNDDEIYGRIAGLEEVNLLEGLAGDDAPLNLPSTRLGQETRQAEFSLRPARPPTPTSKESAFTPSTRTPAILRKSFRKTLPTVSGFRVRMRTVFVPHVLLPGSDAPGADPFGDADALTAGQTERTVVLCIEIENTGESGVGFAIEAIDVVVGGDEGSARVRLVPWGAPGTPPFPLRMGPMEQYNLLYAVELLTAPLPDADDLLGPGSTAPPELQRAVTIHVHGRPFEARADAEALTYPTSTFISQWTTVLDLSPRRNRDSLMAPLVVDGPAFASHRASLAGALAGPGEHEVLPEPASPFPALTPRAPSSFATQQKHRSAPAPAPASLVAGSKRLTVPASWNAPRASTLPSGPGSLHPHPRERDSLGPSPLSKHAYTPTPPSLAVAAYARTPTTAHTTFGPPRTPTPAGALPPPAQLGALLPTGDADEQFLIASPPPIMPSTPAYPAYPHSPVPPTPRAQGPTSTASGSVGPALDVPRGRRSPGSVYDAPAPAYYGEPAPPAKDEDAVVVSVGILAEDGAGRRRIYPQDQFTLDIFVFNQSKWTRRLEVGCPERRRRGRKEEKDRTGTAVGLVPLENRVRVGPLRPGTCQSVRMEFLALTAGVHSIDTLTLTDVETGYVMNLRSVMDVVVHEVVEGP